MGIFIWKSYFLNNINPVNVYRVMQELKKIKGIAFSGNCDKIEEDVYKNRHTAFLSYDQFLRQISLNFDSYLMYENPDCITHLVTEKHFIEIVKNTSGLFDIDIDDFNKWKKTGIVLPGVYDYDTRVTPTDDGKYVFLDSKTGETLEGLSEDEIMEKYLQYKINSK